MTGVKPTDNERSCAEMAKNSNVVRVASDEEAARVISFPVITRCRPTIYFPLHLFPIRPKHAPPFYPLSAFTDRQFFPTSKSTLLSHLLLQLVDTSFSATTFSFFSQAIPDFLTQFTLDLYYPPLRCIFLSKIIARLLQEMES